jgi:hypothetical protein
MVTAAVAAAASTIQGIKVFRSIPKKGMRYLSVNLAGIDVAELMAMAATMGFKPEVVQVPVKSGIQIHALLWEGAIADTPSDMDDKFDELWDKYEMAVMYAAGQSRSEYLANGGVEYEVG